MVCFGVLMCCAWGLNGQDAPFAGLNYQGIARQPDGQALSNQSLLVRLSFSGASPTDRPFYSEVHRAVTDDLGLFQLVIGRGNPLRGTLNEVPWETQNIWLNLEISTGGPSAFELVGRSELQSVPYAFFAESTRTLVNDPVLDLRSTPGPSIYWTIGGNVGTRPPYHFIGNRDKADLVLKTDDTRRVVISEDGQVNIIGGQSGDAKDFAAFPLTVQGSDQGIYIKVNGGRSGENFFMTFADGGPGDGPGQVWGQIKGQTVEELLKSFGYIWQNTLFTIKTTATVASAVGDVQKAIGTGVAGATATASLFFAWAAPGFFTASGAQVASSIANFAGAAQLLAQIVEFNTNSILNVGVSYSSGAGDYAEWLPRVSGERDLVFGEIVGVHAGQISLETQGADHWKVISFRPAIVGNMPPQTEAYRYEKVAFMGQVPVRVMGRVEQGDFILPSGKNDGLGIAVHPDSLAADLHHQIVGVAWESASDRAVNVINTAVGLHRNNLAAEVQAISDKVDRIMAYLQGEAPLHEGESADALISQALPRPTTEQGINPEVVSAALSDEAFDQFLAQEGPQLRQIIGQMEQYLLQNDYDFSSNPYLIRLFEDPVSAMQEFRGQGEYAPLWQQVEQQIIESSTSN